jgi:hypothetical protein
MEYHGGGSQSSANMAAKGGRGGGANGGGRGGDQGNRGGFTRGGAKGGRGSGGGRRSGFIPRAICQLCGKEGHYVVKCFKRFDPSWTGPPQKSAASATTTYGVDTKWDVDSGATDHVTGELEKLSIRDKYHGGDQVHTASGTGMIIDHVGHNTLHSPIRKIQFVSEIVKVCSVFHFLSGCTFIFFFILLTYRFYFIFPINSTQSCLNVSGYQLLPRSAW